MILIKSFTGLSNTELFRMLQLRSRVFVVEQQCVFLDPDDADETAVHLLMKNDEAVVGCARILMPEPAKTISIGRLAVDADFRGKGAGRALMEAAIRYCGTEFPSALITLEAQSYLITFYETLGFRQTGEVYLEDGIPHVSMQLKK